MFNPLDPFHWCVIYLLTCIIIHQIHMYTNIYYIIPYTDDTPPKTNGWTMIFIPFSTESHFPNLQIVGFQPLVLRGWKNLDFPKNRLARFCLSRLPQGRVEEAKDTLVTLRGDAYAETLIKRPSELKPANWAMKKEPLVVWGIYGGLYYPNIWEL